MAKVSTWSKTASNNNSPSPDGAPEGMNPSGVNDTIRENMAQVRSERENSQWFDWGYTPTFIDATNFSLVGDKTTEFHVGRRIQLNDASTLYGVISASAYTTLTTVTVVLDSGALSSSLSSGELSILSSDNDSIPKKIDATKIADGSVSNAAFQYTANLSSDAQTQINSKSANSHNHSGTYEPVFSKNSGFNLNTGIGSGQVAAGNHNHSGTYEPVITKLTGFNKNFGAAAGDVSEGDHSHTLKSAALYSSIGQTIPNNIKTAVNFDLEDHDTSEFHDLSTNNTRITIPAGVSKVRLTGQALFSGSATGQRTGEIWKNGVATYVGRPRLLLDNLVSATTYLPLTTGVIAVSENDYFELIVSQSSGGALTVLASQQYSWFTIEVLE